MTPDDFVVRPGEVAVVGGGRWGRILCRTLAQIGDAVPQIHLVAERNFAGVTDWLENDDTTRESGLTGKRIKR